MASVPSQIHSSGSRQKMVRSNANISVSHAGGAAAADYQAFNSDQDLNELQSPLSGMKPTLDQNPNAPFPGSGNSLYDISSLYASSARRESSFVLDINDDFRGSTSDPNPYLEPNEQHVGVSGENSHQALALGQDSATAPPWSHLSATQGRNSSGPGNTLPAQGQVSQSQIFRKKSRTKSAASGRTSFIDSAYSTLPRDAQNEDESMHDLSGDNMNHFNLDQGNMLQQNGQQSLPEFYPPSQQGDFVPSYQMSPGAQQHFMQSSPTPTQGSQNHQRNQISNRQPCFPCSECSTVTKTKSELNKHIARHRKEFKCIVGDCQQRQKGFPTLNDLDRHLKSVHKINNRKTKDYKCFAKDCSKPDKTWPRLDNFKQHLKSMHGNESMENLLQLSDEWYQKQGREQERQSILDQHDELDSNHPGSQVSAGDNPGMHPLPQRFTAAYPGRHSNLSNRRNFLHQFSSQQFNVNNLDPALFPNQNAPPRGRDRGVSNPVLASGGQPRSVPHPINTSMLPPQNQSMQRTHSYINHPQQHGSMPSMDDHNQIVNLLHTLDDPWSLSTGYSMSAVNPYLKVPQIGAPKRPFTEPNPNLGSNRMTDFPASPIDTHIPVLAKQDDWLSNIGGSADIGDLSATSQPPALLISPPDNESKLLEPPIEKVLTDEIRSFLKDHEERIGKDRSFSQEDLVKRFRISLKSSFDTATNAESCSKSLISGITGNESPSSAVDKKSSNGKEKEYHCPYPGCNKSMKQPSKLSKHIKRHEKAWGCTFDGCSKLFGSKNDWKRHEQKQHEQQECWHCEICPEVFYHHQENFTNHLVTQHRWRQDEATKRAKERRIARNYQGQYWCGFCNTIKVHNRHGAEALSERFNHIDHHFTKEKRLCSDWIELGGRGKTKATLKEESRMKSPSHSEEDEDDEDDKDGGQETQAEDESPTSTASLPPAPIAIQNRLSSERQAFSHQSSSTIESSSQGMSSGSSLHPDEMALDAQWIPQYNSGMGTTSTRPQHSRTARRIKQQLSAHALGSIRPEQGSTGQFIICCQCKVPYVWALSRNCHDCCHPICSDCRVGVPSINTDVPMTME